MPADSLLRAAEQSSVRPARRLNLSVQYALNADALPSRPVLRSWVRAAVEGAAQITLRWVEAEEGQMLNRDYRGRDYATNVLSFPYETEPVLMGDLVLCWPVLLREAAEQKKSVEEHAAHLVVHGCLHLCGFDHENEADAQEMEAQERLILAKLGYADPYANEGAGLNE